MTWLIALKGKLALIVGAVIGLLLLYINILKSTALKKELKQTKAVSRVKDKANEALIKGVEHENKPVNRGYFDTTDD